MSTFHAGMAKDLVEWLELPFGYHSGRPHSDGLPGREFRASESETCRTGDSLGDLAIGTAPQPSHVAAMC